MRIAVVGAGISGLSCALRLQGAGHSVTVFEQLDRMGGRMSTVRPEGLAVDIGANLLLENYTHTRALAAEVGVGDAWFAFQSGRGGILGEDGLEPSPETALDFARFGRLSLASRARLLTWCLRAWRADDALDFFDLSLGSDVHDNVDAWTGFSRVCGEDVVTQVVDPFVRTFHFHGARRISMKYFDALARLFVVRGGFVPSGFRGFMDELPRAIAARLPVRSGVHVHELAPAGTGVEVAHARGRDRFDAAVLAVPAPRARPMLPAASPAQAAVLDAGRYSHTIMCGFRVPADAVGDFEGIWVPYPESRIVCAVSNDRCKGAWDERGVVLTVGLHEEAADTLMHTADAAVLALVADEWGRLYPSCAGRMTGLHVQRWPQALPVYGVGDITRVKAFWAHGQGDGGVWLCGDYLNHPWVEGAVRCGEKVAAAIGA